MGHRAWGTGKYSWQRVADSRQHSEMGPFDQLPAAGCLLIEPLCALLLEERTIDHRLVTTDNGHTFCAVALSSLLI
jgi:hypothetical protein